MAPIKDITARDADITQLEIGYYVPNTNANDQTPKTGIKRGTDTNTWGPPKQGYSPVNRLPETPNDYYIPGTNK
jgi:hypothetical protein